MLGRVGSDQERLDAIVKLVCLLVLGRVGGDQERLDAIVKLVCLLVLERVGSDQERLDAIVKLVCLLGLIIRITFSCNIYPLTPHFYMAKLGYTGVYLFFLFLLQNIDYGYLLEPP